MRKHKVMFLITSLSMGGAERHVLLLAKEMLKYESFEPIIATLSSGGVFYQKAIDAGIRVIYLKRFNRYDLSTIIRLFILLKKEKISILHSHMYFSNFIGRIAGRLAKVPIIISTEHGISLWKNKFLIFFDRFSHKLSDRIITVSELSRQVRINREKIDKNKILTIHNFINIEDFDLNEQIDTDLATKYNIQNTFNIGMMTRLTKNKRVNDAIVAMKTIANDFPKTRLIVLGEGPEKNNLIQLTKDLNMEDKVIFTGYQSDIRSWLNVIDLFLLISKMEDFPVSLLEAMACAKPVIATNVGGIPEIVQDKKTGFLINPEDPENLSKKIIWMIQHEEEMKKMGLKGREYIENHFSNKIILPQIINLYQNLIQEKKLN